MDYYEITKAIRIKLEYVPASAQEYQQDVNYNSDVFSADFEDIICNYVDAINEVKRIKNKNKRWCLLYDVLDYEQDMIAEILRVNQSLVSRNIKWLKRFFSQEVIK